MAVDTSVRSPPPLPLGPKAWHSTRLLRPLESAAARRVAQIPVTPAECAFRWGRLWVKRDD